MTSVFRLFLDILSQVLTFLLTSLKTIKKAYSNNRVNVNLRQIPNKQFPTNNQANENGSLQALN